MVAAHLTEMSGLRDGERMLRINNGDSTIVQRPSGISNTTTCHLIYIQKEEATISDVTLLIQDGGNFLDTKMAMLSMKEER
jgi:hypothetical protein